MENALDDLAPNEFEGDKEYLKIIALELMAQGIKDGLTIPQATQLAVVSIHNAMEQYGLGNIKGFDKDSCSGNQACIDAVVQLLQLSTPYMQKYSNIVLDKQIVEDLGEDEILENIEKEEPQKAVKKSDDYEDSDEYDEEEEIDFDDPKFDRDVEKAKPIKNLNQIKVDLASVDIHGVLVGSPDMQEASIKLYQHMVRNGLSENEALALIDNKLIEVHNNPFATPQNAAFHLALGGAIEACAINPTCANFVAITLTAAFATGKINAEGFDIADDIDTTLWTPETKLDIKDEGFIPENIDTTLPGFEIADFDFGDEGFTIPEKIDTSILMKLQFDENGKFQPEKTNLADSEGGNGHAIERHVGKSDGYLSDRAVKLANEAGRQGRPHAGATTFPDYETANKATIEVLKQNTKAIEEWAANKDSSNRKLEIDKDFGSKVIGYGFASDGKKFESTRVKTILIKSKDKIEILTSYPIK